MTMKEALYVPDVFTPNNITHKSYKSMVPNCTNSVFVVTWDEIDAAKAAGQKMDLRAGRGGLSTPKGQSKSNLHCSQRQSHHV